MQDDQLPFESPENQREEEKARLQSGNRGRGWWFCDAIQAFGKFNMKVGLKIAQERRLRTEASSERHFWQGLRQGKGLSRKGM